MGLYLYSVTPQKPEIETSGIEDSEVYSLRFKKLHAVVSQIEFREEMDPTEEEVEKHKEINSAILEQQAVVPVAYGMVFKSKKILLNTMSEVYAELRRSYLAVRDKVELGVKVLGKEEVDKEAILKPLQEVSFKGEEGELFSDRLLLNRSFLVKREVVDQFSAEIDELKEDNPGLKIKYTGPWPPYNFVDIKVMKKGR